MEKTIIEELTLCPLFSGLSQAEIEHIMDNVPYRIISIERGDNYAVAGTLCRFADIILEGEMQADMTANSGRFVLMDNQRAGNLIAPAFIFAKKNRYPVSISATKQTKIFRILPEELQKLIQANSVIQMNFIGMISNISVYLAGKVRVLGLATVRERIAQFLLHQCDLQQTLSIHLPYTRQELADRLGIQRFSLQRTMAEFEDQGIIRIEGKDIIIQDKDKLMRQE